MGQAFDLGRFLRRRYSGFLPDSYTAGDIYVRSVDYDRCLMTAECVLAGLYFPQNDSNLWNKDIKWSPIPVHTINSKTDYLLKSLANCPKLGRISDASLVSPSAQAYAASNKTFLDFLSLKTGLNVTLDQCSNLCDVFQCERAQNLKWSDWVTDDIVNKVCEVAYYLLAAETVSRDMKTMFGGVLLDKLRNDINDGMVGATFAEEGKYITMLSGQDTTLIGALAALDIFDNKKPNFASCIIVELNKQPNAAGVVQFYIRVLYKTDPASDDLKQLILPACKGQFDCPADVMLGYLNSNALAPNDFIKMCA